MGLGAQRVLEVADGLRRPKGSRGCSSVTTEPWFAPRGEQRAISPQLGHFQRRRVVRLGDAQLIDSFAPFDGAVEVPRVPHSIPIAILAVALCLGTGCRSPRSAPSAPEAARDTVECVDPRSPICTQDYRPVCGLRDTGTRCVTTPCDSTEWKTYSNACAACSDSSVERYRPGACEADR
jgi:hypothetical protein